MNYNINRAIIGPAILAAAGTPVMAAPGAARPNIVFIMCDDMGYGDLGCYGQKYISTPCIDSLANHGRRFTQAYAGSPVSAPSRASLMTGQHSGHCEVRGNKEYWRDVPKVRYGVNDEYSVSGQHPYSVAHVVLPEVMKAQGYATGMFGKWAGGYEGSESTPDKRGVDEFYGYICQYQAHLYYPNFLNRYRPELGDTATVRVIMEENVQWPMFGADYARRTQYSADMIHREALDWLDRRSADEPFIGLFTYTLPHAELYQPEDSLLHGYKKRFFRDHTWGGQEGSRYNATTHTHAQFAAMISRLDAYVGQIMDKLREKGLEENTLVIFTSDNGPHEEGGADPEFFGRDGELRGLKRQTLEGGIRVPFIAYWPGRVAAGTTDSTMIAFYDLLPTFAELAGEQDVAARYADSENYFDGHSIVAALTGEGEQKQHDFLYWEFDETDQVAVRKGPWKMISRRGAVSLYNLDSDLREERDVAVSYPEIVAELVDIARREHTPNPNFKVTVP